MALKGRPVRETLEREGKRTYSKNRKSSFFLPPGLTHCVQKELGGNSGNIARDVKHRKKI